VRAVIPFLSLCENLPDYRSVGAAETAKRISKATGGGANISPSAPGGRNPAAQEGFEITL
jgi:hypothetical protein